MNSRTGPPGPPETMHSPGGVGRPILSQSEDQSRPHPVLTFVHPMSTQVRCLGPDTAESAHRSDPQIATRTRKRVSGQVTDYLENWIKLFGYVSRGRDRRLHHLDPRQKTPQTPFPGIDIGCHPGLRAPRSPGFLQPVCSTPRSGTEHQGASCSRNQFYSTCAIPISESTNRSISSGRYPLSVCPSGRGRERRVGAQAGTGTRVTLLRPAGRDGWSLRASGGPARAGSVVMRCPAGSCGARVLYWSGCCRATRPGSRPRP